jgi:hypothetical protein
MTIVYKKRFNELAEQLGDVEKTLAQKWSSYDQSHYQSVDDDLLLNWCVKTRNLIASACGRESEHFLSFLEAEKAQPYLNNDYTTRRVKAVFLAAKEDFEGGYLSKVRTLVQAEVFGSELEQAEELLSAGYFVAAAVIAGVVLETSLRLTCEQIGIPEGKLDKMNSDLAKAGKYNSLVQKRITAVAGLRNSAAHGKSNEFSREDVSAMIADVERIIRDLLT